MIYCQCIILYVAVNLMYLGTATGDFTRTHTRNWGILRSLFELLEQFCGKNRLCILCLYNY